MTPKQPRTTHDTQGVRWHEGAKPTWSRAVEAPFVDVFHLVDDKRLLVGAVGWERETARFAQRDLFLIDVKTGDQLWRVKRSEVLDGTYSFLGVAAGSAILQVSQADKTHWIAFSLQNGTESWRHSVGDPAIAALDGNGNLLVATHRVVRLVAADGHRRWDKSFKLREKRFSPSMASDDQRVCIVASDITCVELATGKEIWRKPLADETRVVSTAIIAGLLVVASDAAINTWSAANGSTRWYRSVPGKQLSSFAMNDDTAYAIGLDASGNNARVQAIRISTGDVRWTSETIPPPRGPLTATADTLYLSTPAALYALDAGTGLRAGRAPMPLEIFAEIRTPDIVLVDETTVTVVTENGVATYVKDSLALQGVVNFSGAQTWSDARWFLKSHPHASLAGIQTATLYSPVAPPSAGTLAHFQVAVGAKSMGLHGTALNEMKATFHAERVAATLNLVGAAVSGLAMAFVALGIEPYRQDVTDGTLARYFTNAANLRLEGTPSGYVLASRFNSLPIYDPLRKASGSVFHSPELMTGWQHVALITPDGAQVIGAHVPFDGSHKTTKLNDIVTRHHMSVEGYALDEVKWEPVGLPPREPFVADIRAGRARTLGDAVAYERCKLYDSVFQKASVAQVYEAAILANNREVLRELEENGFGYRVAGTLELAVGMGLSDVADDLRAVHKRQEDAGNLGFISAFDKLDDARKLLDAGANPNGHAFNTKSTCYVTPLSQAKSVAMAELLLAKGAQVNIIGEKGTPLDWQIAAKNEPLIKLLRSRGAKTSAELGTAK